MTDSAAFAITIFNTKNLKVWRSDDSTVVLSVDRFGVVNAITLMGLTAGQVASLVETFGRWVPAAKGEEVAHG